ncbi:hypothetical protein [Xanthomonas vasicola]|uniref:Uncharacterized protein n=5 Tax=Xanthomonas vasicola TaxID=56459 RepID=A0ABD7S6N9_XANVA|nr:hypothetical protein [Xanthomonas vasicola]RNK49550.1 hypothetical protein C9396_01250 [Xanthomonas vasicola pv. vasculorum]RNK52981.1 hypothetical protein C9402_19275 [Xanthomonas vasicola pv. vasculorum]RNK57327.1 hypothetical protein C9393_08230 [Xanthomonas vasicola pv. vasculorum]RNK62460.1 hypothetical protein C9394_20935 [Xanthomonas vasicola pv. vasculorum]RNK70521.1 hypothetical protein C9399_00205 [Xanthomonas vasicola pv. vasculorum]
MSYMKKWIGEHVAEVIKANELSRWVDDADMKFAMYVVECGQGAQLAQDVGREIGNETIVAIAQTVIDTIDEVSRGGTPRTRSYRKITDKQRYVLAVALLEKYGSARGIAAAGWGLTADEIDNAEV